MPATEQTWRNQKQMHKIFGASCVVLLVTTVWMFLADHNREWKQYQRTARDIEMQMNSWNQRQYLTDEVMRLHDELSTDLLRIQSQPLDEKLLEQFREEVNADAEFREVDKHDFAKVDQAVDNLAELAEAASIARAEAASLYGRWNEARSLAAGEKLAAESAREKIATAKPEERAAAEETAATLTKTAAALSQRAEELEELYAAADKAALDAEAKAKQARLELVERLQTIINAAKFREVQALDERKSVNGLLDAKKGELGIAIRDDLPEDRVAELQSEVDKLKQEVARLTLRAQHAGDHRKKLDQLLQDMLSAQEEAAKKLADNQADLERLRKANIERRSTYFVGGFPWLGKKWLEMPILDAFGSPLKIENKWDDDNRIDFNFSRVRRYDRCTTCHQAMEKTMPGTADVPAYVSAQDLYFALPTPSEDQVAQAKKDLEVLIEDWEEHKEKFGDDHAGPKPMLEELLYGIRIAAEGEYLLNRSDVTISFVQPVSRYSTPGGAATDSRLSSRGAEAALIVPESEHTPVMGEKIPALTSQYSDDDTPAEPPKPGLMVGDVLVEIGSDVIEGRDEARQILLNAQWGQPLRLRVRRGLPNPYTSHPRLDLFVGSMSPHTMAVFACTICHEGQGSATTFKYASHAPNTVKQMEDWSRDHGWFDNHHWIFPMSPKRFEESTCVKCHFDIEALAPSERFPDPPAPKLTRGYNLISKYGCYGCHEINGYDGPERVAPDLRLEPNYFAAAQQLLSELPAREASLAAVDKQSDAQLAEIQQQIESLTEKKAALEQLWATEAEAYKARLLDGEEDPELLEGLAERRRGILALDRQIDELNSRTNLTAQIAADQKTLADIRQLAETLAHHPEDTSSRHKLYELMEGDERRVVPELPFGPVLSEPSRKLLPLFKDVETPGTMRKAGPALRYLASKVDPQWLADWLANPQNFRPGTRMPRFFGLWNHLDGNGADGQKSSAELLAEKHRLVAQKHKLQAAEDTDEMELQTLNTQIQNVDRQLAGFDEGRYEPIEIRATMTYLLKKSQPFGYLEPPSGITQSSVDEKVARGKNLFETRGCLACHDHSAFPDAPAYRPPQEIVQGPDLSNVAAKFSPERNPNGPKWLYTWIKRPTKYHVRTLMPADLFLEPIAEKSAEGEVAGVTDPVEDIVEFLLAQPADWLPLETFSSELDPVSSDVLDRMTKMNLSDAFSEVTAGKYAVNGIPESLLGELKGAEIEMIITPEERQQRIDDQVAGLSGADREEKFDQLTKELLVEKKLLYIGRKTIGRYGCYGCHDIPGFEDAKTIGTGLADWGRKESSKLAFEHILQYLDHHGHGETHEDHGRGDEQPEEAGESDFTEADEQFYHHALVSGHRSGFIYQKLLEPRSYDYHRTQNIKYNERLRMPQFAFNGEEREAIITFVLGLVSDPPAPQYVYAPKEREKTLIEGRRLINKFNCDACHMLETERWDITYQPGDYQPPSELEMFPVAKAHFSHDEIAQSQQADRRGRLHATLSGLPMINPSPSEPQYAGLPSVYGLFDGEYVPVSEYYDESFDPTTLQYRVQLWQPVLLNGHAWPPKSTPPVMANSVEQRFPTEGGMLAKYLVPRAIALAAARGSDTAKKVTEAWGWVPPPLVGEGKKVQTDWLHDFLLDPYAIRPAVILRMPKFNMSPDEATALVNYFAARANAEYPYEFLKQRRDGHLNEEEEEFQQRIAALTDADALPEDRLDAALNIVGNKKNGCAQCHFIGDFDPGGDPLASGPNLARVYRRLRPDYVRRWVAQPDQILPYTGMQAVIKYDPSAPHLGGFPQEVFPGSSVDQLDGVVDLLMNFDEFTARRVSMKEIIEAKAAAMPAEEEAPGTDAAGNDAAPPDNPNPDN